MNPNGGEQIPEAPPPATNVLRGRWRRELTTYEIRRVLQTKRLDVAESTKMGVEFFCSKMYLAIIRTSGAGGDVFNVHGGWKYDNLIVLLQDWTEICSIADKVTAWEKNRAM